MKSGAPVSLDHLRSVLSNVSFEGVPSVYLILEKPAPGVHQVVDAATVRAGWGLENDHPRKDFFRGERVLGRQVSAISREFCAAAGIDCTTIGDNLVTSGIDLRTLRPGDRLLMGSAVLVRSQPRHRPCTLFRERTSAAIYQVAFDDDWRGALFDVVTGGTIRVGSEIARVLPDSEE
ncbi:MAG: sulfurase [Bacteroidetes bacterium]|nr:sulfurase [Bacteroidota bacterium]